MLNLIADYPFWFALFVVVISGVPTVVWWRWYNRNQQPATGIQFSCICGKNFPSKMKLDSHQQDGSCPKQVAKKVVQQPKLQASKSVPLTNIKKPSLLQKQVVDPKAITATKSKPKALRKSIKIKPRKKTPEKKKEEDIISINEFAKSKAKISISKR